MDLFFSPIPPSLTAAAADGAALRRPSKGHSLLLAKVECRRPVLHLSAGVDRGGGAPSFSLEHPAVHPVKKT